MSEPKFAAGDKVTFTNDYGVAFAGKTILREALAEDWQNLMPRYYITPTDTPWFPVREDQLRIEREVN